MKKAFSFLLGLALFSCNPYEQYFFTHYYIQAELDPASALLSANVQMVYVARQDYTDSICFRLNPGVEVHSLASQELVHYRFGEYDRGMLVIYIEEPVAKNDRLHISLSYSGKISPQEVRQLDSTLFWLPANEDTGLYTYQVKIALPKPWKVMRPAASSGQHGKWQLESRKPRESLIVELERE